MKKNAIRIPWKSTLIFRDCLARIRGEKGRKEERKGERKKETESLAFILRPTCKPFASQIFINFPVAITVGRVFKGCTN